jgi:hypothetical protein
MMPLDWHQAIETCSRGWVITRMAWDDNEVVVLHSDGWIYSTKELVLEDVEADDWLALDRVH